MYVVEIAQRHFILAVIYNKIHTLKYFFTYLELPYFLLIR